MVKVQVFDVLVELSVIATERGRREIRVTMFVGIVLGVTGVPIVKVLREDLMDFVDVLLGA